MLAHIYPQKPLRKIKVIVITTTTRTTVTTTTTTTTIIISIITQRLKKLICLHLPADRFVEISLYSTGLFASRKSPIEWREISMKQSIGKCKQINF